MDIQDPNSSPPRTPPPRSPEIPQTPSSAGRVNQTPSRFNFPDSSPSFRKRRRSNTQQNAPASITRESRATPSISTPMRTLRRRTIALNASDVTRILADTGRSSEAFNHRRTSFLHTPGRERNAASQQVQESPSDLLQALAKMIAPGANLPESLSRHDHRSSNTPTKPPRTPRRSLNNRKLSGLLPGTPRRSSFRNTAFTGHSYRARNVRKDVETPARVNRLADIRTPSDLLRLLTRMPDFQKDPSPTQVPNQRDRSLADLIEQEGDIHFPPTPQGEHGRESILPDMSLEEMHMRFQLLDEDEKTFVRDSLEFGFRHHRNRRGLLSSDDDDIERQRRMTYNSDATFGDSMWEDDEEEKIDDNVSMNDEGAPSVPHLVDHHHKLSRESTDEIDLTTQVQELAAKKEQQEALPNIPKQPSPPPAVEQEDDMAVDFDAQIGEGDEYEVDEDIHDNAESTHMETKQTRLSQLGFAPIDTLESRLSSTQISRPKLQPQSPIKEPERPLVQVTLAQLAARSGDDVDQLRRDTKAPVQKVSEAGIVVPNLPKALVKDLFSSFARSKVSREALETVMEASHQFFAQASEDLSVYAGHAGRTMIQEDDVQCLMRRQRLLNDKVSMESLAHKLLPRELWDEICVSALANNELHPHRQTPQ
ncbi:centromere kinetochore component CENP-T-domain-containing protein [Umbelopsis sp. PMI_123]|nr:centromere kinetochore component CENP-T-domain-containing protein [Umbelopsis sp. PMI_123]